MKKLVLLGCLVTALGFHPSSAEALTTTVVSNATELQNALTLAQGDNDDNRIILEPGNYNFLGVTFTYEAEPDENRELTIIGAGPLATVLDGLGDHRVLNIDTTDVIDPRGPIVIQNLSIVNGETAGGAAGLSYIGTAYPGDAERIEIRNVHFASNHGGGTGGAAYIGNAAEVHVESCLFFNNSSGIEGIGGLFLSHSLQATFFNNIFSQNTRGLHIAATNLTEGEYEVVNNTFVNEDEGLYIYFWEDTQSAEIYNNIFYDAPILIEGRAQMVTSPTIDYFNNLAYGLLFPFFNDCAPCSVVNEGGNFIGDPLFVNLAAGDVRPASESPAINAGHPIYNNTPIRDFFSNMRVSGAAIDLGAIERIVPWLIVHPGAVDFGPLTVGESATQQIIFMNAGEADLEISSMFFAGFGFSNPFRLNVNGGVEPCASATPTLAPGASCTIAVSFKPNQPGDFSYDLQINSNDPEEVFAMPVEGSASLFQ